VLDLEFAHSLAQDFIAGFNARDLDRILSHYSEDVEMVSPLAVAVTGAADGKVAGKAALRAYWTKALERIGKTEPDLRLDLVALLAGMQCLTIVFRGIGGKLACDTLFVGADGLVHRTVAQYAVER
jgi:hypothetical protein